MSDIAAATAGAPLSSIESIRKRFRQFGETLGYAARTLGLITSSSRSLLATQIGLSLVSAVVPLAMAYAGKRIVDAVVARHRDEALTWVLMELGLVVVLSFAQRGLGLSRQLLSAKLGFDLNFAILEKAQKLDLTFFENAEFYDKLTRARREASSRPVALVSDCFRLLQDVVTLCGYAVLLASFSFWVIPVLFLATIPATLAEMHYSKLTFRVRNWRSPDTRRLLYLEHVLANDEHVKEVKLFGIGPLLLRRYRDLTKEFYQEDKRLALRRAGWTHALSLLGSIAFYGTYAGMALAAAYGRLGIGDLTLYVVSLRQGQQAFQSCLSGIGNIYEHNLYMSNLFDYLAIPPRVSLLPGPRRAVSAPLDELGLRFEDVGYRYPGSNKYALRHINLFIPPGEGLALVGQNGAGKTTFVKLLTGMYQPSEGRILLDGRDLSEYPPDDLHRRFAVLFQDFNQYQFKVKDNVGLGSVDHMEDEARIQRAIENGGASEVVAALPKGLEQPLGHWFEKGSELSGGQWQKLGLARAFMREEANILILDEPTAALDAAAEHAVFERFQELARGRTSIIISHRFPTVRMADRILVLENGEIIESGDHASLVAENGRYAEWFELQAAGYR